MKIPNKLSAGTSIRWQFTSEYAAQGWGFSYLLRGKSTIDIDAEVICNLVAVNIPPSITSTWVAGIYEWKLFISQGDEKLEIESGKTTIEPNFATIGSGHDARSHARKMLDSINNILEGRILSDHERYSIEGRSLDRIPIAELHRLKKSYTMKVKAEETGSSFRLKRILTRFSS